LTGRGLRLERREKLARFVRDNTRKSTTDKSDPPFARNGGGKREAEAVATGRARMGAERMGNGSIRGVQYATNIH